jgi:cystathionine beta-lyase/cystathionine gamma-synthase
MRGSAGLFSFVPKNQDDAWVKRFVESLEIFKLGVSWGGFESLVVTLPLQNFSDAVNGWIVRLYAGLEDSGDLIADIEQAFHRASG